MEKLQIGDVVIVNDLIGFCKEKYPGENTITLSTLEGDKKVLLCGNWAVMANASEIARSYAIRMQGVISKL